MNIKIYAYINLSYNINILEYVMMNFKAYIIIYCISYYFKLIMYINEK